jgi:2-polyprenyl-3-methyl-5-hydroxy-6-metoxy-1,4-benzoquinol methylase
MTELPTCDDRPIWDTWFSAYSFPALTAADELGIFAALAAQPDTSTGVAGRLQLSERGAGILLALLAALGFLSRHDGRFHVTDLARNYLLADSPFYWGGVIHRARGGHPLHGSIMEAVRSGTAPGSANWSESKRPVDAWEEGDMQQELARGIAAFMHSHSLPSALGLARNLDLRGVRRLLDVGGGSGCFCIALAQRNPALRCTIMDLPAMCAVADEYVREAGMQDRVDTCAVDMFRQQWPDGYDALLFSNVFHDWSPETCAELAAKAHVVLPPGGRIFIHEMLLDETGTGPRTVAAFSLLMLLGTRGQQFTFAELKNLLQGAGFTDIGVTLTYGYFSVVSGQRR